MFDVKILPGDVVIADRSLAPKHLSIVLATIDGEPTLKRLNPRGGVMPLVLALIDGNSFYCSCKRVFDAKLER